MTNNLIGKIVSLTVDGKRMVGSIVGMGSEAGWASVRVYGEHTFTRQISALTVIGG